MSWDLTDYDQNYLEMDLVGDALPCAICHDAPASSDDYCAACQALVDELEADVAISCEQAVSMLKEAAKFRLAPIAVLQPITVRPVELNAALWAEFKADVQDDGLRGGPVSNAQTIKHYEALGYKRVASYDGDVNMEIDGRCMVEITDDGRATEYVADRATNSWVRAGVQS